MNSISVNLHDDYRKLVNLNYYTQIDMSYF